MASIPQFANFTNRLAKFGMMVKGIAAAFFGDLLFIPALENSGGHRLSHEIGLST